MQGGPSPLCTVRLVAAVARIARIRGILMARCSTDQWRWARRLAMAYGAGSFLRDGNLAHRGDRARAPLEAGPQESVDGVHVIGLDDQEECVLGVRAVASDHADPRHGLVVQRIGPTLIPRA